MYEGTALEGLDGDFKGALLDKYSVRKEGSIFLKSRGTRVRVTIRKGRNSVNLALPGYGRRNYFVDTLVMLVYSKDEPLVHIDHKNGNFTDDYIKNLEYIDEVVEPGNNAVYSSDEENLTDLVGLKATAIKQWADIEKDLYDEFMKKRQRALKDYLASLKESRNPIDIDYADVRYMYKMERRDAATNDITTYPDVQHLAEETGIFAATLLDGISNSIITREPYLGAYWRMIG